MGILRAHLAAIVCKGLMYVPSSYLLLLPTPHTDGFHSAVHRRNWRAKISCDAISKQHGDVMSSSCHSEKVWNPSMITVLQNAHISVCMA